MKNLKRRFFIKSSSLVAGGLVLPSFNINRMANLFNKKPLIGVLGLNPHNAEFRKNSEEKKIIIPSIKALKKKGIKVKGPLISDNVFIGSNSSLVAPVSIGKNSVVGAGSVITKNVKKKSLALTRASQISVTNYKRKKK